MLGVTAVGESLVRSGDALGGRDLLALRGAGVLGTLRQLCGIRAAGTRNCSWSGGRARGGARYVREPVADRLVNVQEPADVPMGTSLPTCVVKLLHVEGCRHRALLLTHGVLYAAWLVAQGMPGPAEAVRRHGRRDGAGETPAVRA